MAIIHNSLTALVNILTASEQFKGEGNEDFDEIQKKDRDVISCLCTHLLSFSNFSVVNEAGAGTIVDVCSSKAKSQAAIEKNTGVRDGTATRLHNARCFAMLAEFFQWNRGPVDIQRSEDRDELLIDLRSDHDRRRAARNIFLKRYLPQECLSAWASTPLSLLSGCCGSRSGGSAMVAGCNRR